MPIPQGGLTGDQRSAGLFFDADSSRAEAPVQGSGPTGCLGPLGGLPTKSSAQDSATVIARSLASRQLSAHPAARDANNKLARVSGSVQSACHSPTGFREKKNA